MKTRYIGIILFVSLCARPAAWGQSPNGSIVGEVSDTTGAVIANSKVILTNSETNQNRSANSDDRGFYRFPELAPGRYKLRAEMTGFKSAEVRDIILQVSQTARVDVVMNPGETNELVEVVGASPLLENETSSIGQVIDSKQIIDIPLNGRSFLDLAKLVPGVTNTGTGRGSEINQKIGPNFGIVVNGQRSGSISYLIDGVEGRNMWEGTINVLPSVDAIEEFKVQENSYPAEYGLGGSVVNIALKSGTNKIHGAIFDFLRNDKLDAANYFTNLTGAQKDALRQNQFGATLGGPLKKDKVFLFGSYEGRRSTDGKTLLGNVPGASERTGDFSAPGEPTIYDPTTGQPFPGNIIPSNRISEFATVALTIYPLPNFQGVGANFARSISDQDNFDNYTTKADINISEKDAISGHFSYYTQDVTQLDVMPLTGQTLPNKAMNTSISERHTFNSKMINEFWVGYNYGNLRASQETTHEPISATQFGLQNTEVSSPDFYGVPLIRITGISGLGTANGGFRPEGGRNHMFQFLDHITVIRGRHTIKAGADIRHIRYRGLNGFLPRGAFGFGNQFTQSPTDPTSGNAVADFLLGDAQFAGAGVGDHQYHLWGNNYNGFVQDDIKLKPSVTLNVGLRYENTPPFTDRLNQLLVFSFSQQRFLLAGKDTSRGLLTSDNNNFSPRIGVAWSPGASKKFVVRTGYGIFYDAFRLYGNESSFLHHNPPFLNLTFLSSSPPTPISTSQLFPPAPPADQASNPGQFPNPGLLIFSFDPKMRTPYTQQWNLNLQWEIVPKLLLDVAYVGSHSVKLMGRTNPNQARPDVLPGLQNATALQGRRPYPNFGQAIYTTNQFQANYNALQVKLNKRFSGGLSILGSYTFSKTLDVETSTAGDYVQDSNNIRADYGLSTINAKHRAVATVIWEPPFGRNRRFGSNLTPVLNALLGNWQANAIVTMQSGFPINVTSPVSSNQNGEGPVRPDRVCDGNLPRDQRTRIHYIDTSCFVPQPFGRFGNAGRNVLVGPGINNWDISLFKAIPIRDRFNLQFRAEFFNTFNHTQFDNPDTWTVGTPSYGVLLSAVPAREIQFGLKLVF